MALLLFLATLLPGAVLAFTSLKRERGGAGLLFLLALVGYVAGGFVSAYLSAYDPRATPVWAELFQPWRAPLSHLPAAAGATLGVAIGVVSCEGRTHERSGWRQGTRVHP